MLSPLATVDHHLATVRRVKDHTNGFFWGVKCHAYVNAGSLRCF